jgi:hypothetical protein
MTEFLNTNKIALSYLKPVTSWKGKTITQITSSIKKNPGNFAVSSSKNRNLFLPNPLKIYRREIANPIDMSHCYQRRSLSIDEINRPNGSINNTASKNINGLVNTLDDSFPNITCEKPGTCLTFLSPSENAKRRCRSSGIIKKAYNPANNLPNYYTDTTQYLVSRNKTFLQNQYNYIRVGDPLLKPSPGLAATNIYSPNGLPVCPKYHIPVNCSFNYQWVDGNYYQVNIESGYYDASDFNGKLQLAMSQNYHFLINNNGSKVFLLSIIYDDNNNLLEFQSLCYDEQYFPSRDYSSDLRADSNWTLHNSGTGVSPPSHGPNSSLVPGFQFTDNKLLPALGITTTSLPINVPSQSITVGIGQVGTNAQTYTTNQIFTSNTNPGLKSVYKKIYYKPNNSQFAQQGAVSSSSLINRKKYDTINTSAYKTSGNIFGTDATKAYGGNIANALAYGVSENPYTMKNKIGYPNISYPSFLPGSNIQRNCMETSISGGVKFHN